jgi:dTDP-4-amino-4,6-dideoxygalactose transaminase
MDKVIHVGSPQMSDIGILMPYIRKIYDNNWFTNNGEYVQALERRLKDILRVKHCMAIVNGTTALQIAAKACDVKGDIVVPAFTFPATAYAFLWMGYNVHLCDIDPETHLIDIHKLDEYLSKNPNCDCIVPVHLWGEMCDTNGIGNLAKMHGCKVIYDAAHAFLCNNWNGESAGTKGLCTVYSFHATKFFNTIEGGAITTYNDEIARKVGLMRNFGFAGVDDVQIDGINGKMHEISAVVGLTNLTHIYEVRSACMDNYHTYKSIIDTWPPGVMIKSIMGQKRNWTGRNYQYIVMDIDSEITGVTRDTVLQRLIENSILARRYFWPGLHKLPPFNKSYWSMPNTDAVASRIICLPTGINIGPTDIHRICNIIYDVLRGK